MSLRSNYLKIITLRTQQLIKLLPTFLLMGVVVIHPFRIPGASNATETEIRLDARQAKLMLEFLQGISTGRTQPGQIEHIMKAIGTDLIIGQLNLMRRVAHKQYKQLLSGMLKGSLPDIQPIDSGERAHRGVQGLQQIWQILQWGVNNINILKKRIDHLLQLDVYQAALSQAKKYLPDSLNLSPSLFIVMGGRAGAAALNGQKIYLDVLAMSFSRARKKIPFLNNEEVIDYFSHEMHHIGFSQLMKQKYTRLFTSPKERRIFNILKGLVSEGSASYLVLGHRQVSKLAFADRVKDPEKFFITVQQVLDNLQSGKIQTEAQFEKALGQFMGNNFHIAGTAMLSTIDRAMGIKHVLAVISDPRKLLKEYNKSAEKLYTPFHNLFLFDQGLVEKLENLGRSSDF